MNDRIRQANLTTKLHFENENWMFYRGQIPKAAKMKKYLCENITKVAEVLRTFPAKEA